MSASVRLEGSHFWQVLAVGIPALVSHERSLVELIRLKRKLS